MLPGISDDAFYQVPGPPHWHPIGMVMQPQKLLITRSCHLALTTLAIELASSDT